MKAQDKEIKRTPMHPEKEKDQDYQREIQKEKREPDEDFKEKEIGRKEQDQQ